MVLSTFLQPDNTAQSGSVYKGALDASTDVMARLAAAFAAHQQSTANLTVAIDAGSIFNVDTEALTAVASTNTATLTAPSANPRKDIITIDEATGAVAVAEGTEDASPSDPTIPAGKRPVARINWTVSMSEITNADLDDLRPGQFTGFLKPDGDGSNLTGISVGASKTDMRLAFLMIAENAGDRLNMIDGIADPFTDESDVDTATSTNETYDAAGDFYTSVSKVLIDASGETLIGDMTSSGGLAGAFNGVWDNVTGSAESTSDTAGPRFVGVDWGVGVTKTITKCVVKSPTDNTMQPGGVNNITVALQGSTDNFSSSTVDLGTLVIGTSVANTAYEITGLVTTTDYRYHRIKITSTGAAGRLVIAEVELSEAFLNSMTLVSNAFTADSVPATGRVHIQVNEIDAVTINTDLTAEISRDGGTNWALATLVLQETLADGTKAYEDDDVTISGQPSGTAIKYRIKTLNTKEIQVHGVVLQWA